MSDVRIRKASATDADAVWDIIHEVISQGDTYAFAPDTSREEMLAYWFARGAHPFVAVVDDRIAGTYVIKNNQPGLGSHIANAAFMTAAGFRGRGIAKAMGLHALKAAKAIGYTAMQFNFVVASNQAAVALWQRLGFQIMAEIPEAFRHATLGLTGAYIMYRRLDDQ